MVIIALKEPVLKRVLIGILCHGWVAADHVVRVFERYRWDLIHGAPGAY